MITSGMQIVASPKGTALGSSTSVSYRGAPYAIAKVTVTHQCGRLPPAPERLDDYYSRPQRGLTTSPIPLMLRTCPREPGHLIHTLLCCAHHARMHTARLPQREWTTTSPCSREPGQLPYATQAQTSPPRNTKQWDLNFWILRCKQK